MQEQLKLLYLEEQENIIHLTEQKLHRLKRRLY